MQSHGDGSPVEDAVAYLVEKYPRTEELSNARLKFMVYLADWKSAIERGCQITSLTWEFGEYGPYNPDLARLTENREDLSSSRRKYPGLEDAEREILDFVIAAAEKKSFTELTKLVYSTHPFITQLRYAKFDLAALAQDYERIKPLFRGR